MLTREMLLEQREKLTADLNATHGAIQAIEWCLSVLEEGSSDPSSSLDVAETTDEQSEVKEEHCGDCDEGAESRCPVQECCG